MFEVMMCGFSGIIGSFLTLWACRDMVARSSDYKWRSETDAMYSELQQSLETVREDVHTMSGTFSELLAEVNAKPRLPGLAEVDAQVEQLWQAVNDLGHSMRPASTPSAVPEAVPLKVATNGQIDW